MLFLIIFIVLILILFMPIPLKFKLLYSKDRYYIKFYNVNLISTDGGILNKFLNRKEKKEKTKSEDTKNDTNINSKKKNFELNYKLLIKNIYFRISRNKFKPSIKFKSDTIYSLGDASRTAIFLGVFYNINPILRYIFSIIFKVKVLDTDFKPIFKDKILFEITISSIITFNLAQIIYMGIIIYKCIFDDSIIKK
ncbi:DUF2953 domain-containing protein [Clostridium sp. D53t1_180928_C8]|uniref:DUF2953 domain-containing protein n=1 Tax=Clostridium sp. D53t1_180928_C8 TaxID=2787101 RepID=UPI0018AC4153|nr:DUF2953 domain-containing protein [Clostridium sp. D53t1_180928_C8]